MLSQRTQSHLRHHPIGAVAAERRFVRGLPEEKSRRAPA
jgi:hypothetical protein